jgi:hypothetical protein
VDQHNSIGIAPAPTDEEAAAIVAAVATYLAGQRTAVAPATPARPWAVAARLASQGVPIARRPGVRVTWANAARLARMRSQ